MTTTPRREQEAPATSTATPAVDPTKVATPDSAREDLVRFTGSGYAVVRHVFVQKHDGQDRSSTLARICKNKKRRALILYLLVLTWWTPEKGPLRSEAWLRLLTVNGGSLTWSRSSLSEAWTNLVDMGLIERARVRRMAHVSPRREDAEDDYSKPDGVKKINRYFLLPGAFWTEKWFDTLSLPALCMLLLLLKETNDDQVEFHITHEQVQRWYGISASSAAKGFAELNDLGLISVRPEQVPNWQTPTGYTYHLHYRLNGDFSTKARKKARAAARKGASDRAAVSKTTVAAKRKRVTKKPTKSIAKKSASIARGDAKKDRR